MLKHHPPVIQEWNPSIPLHHLLRQVHRPSSTSNPHGALLANRGGLHLVVEYVDECVRYGFADAHSLTGLMRLDGIGDTALDRAATVVELGKARPPIR